MNEKTKKYSKKKKRINSEKINKTKTKTNAGKPLLHSVNCGSLSF